ncbi:hypothetical protein CP10139811_1659 [Chlamydia ibidis]|uniref:Uncharacterized protein n=1 Tax=Chlamydia ibidis TaxID=1405396 RepID=S7KMA5_9CHLA|nr:hypothetical protein CP082626L3_1313 [Chlamydia psittaci 08-2626_L3]EPP30955.1 hypothetical protein CP8484711_2950 [Chlamydia psittaci 84-8471/1]EPP35580.1 hypothetical protein CP10139811_1659 [Chlamydia ibidis]EPP37252.1 hypothetical protein CP10743SC13_2079 [Chlamydia psittaci 10_743_SC13]
MEFPHLSKYHAFFLREYPIYVKITRLFFENTPLRRIS